MIVALDVHYDEPGDLAFAAAVVFAAWPDAQAAAEHRRSRRGLAPYAPGQLYRRELPCLLPLLGEVRADFDVETIIVDGYVDLGEGRPGLGRHLYAALGGSVEVVGVAKSPFVGADAGAVVRGGSTRPLWVTSTGDHGIAARGLRCMHGEHRIPTLLRRVDRLARDRDPTGAAPSPRPISRTFSR